MKQQKFNIFIILLFLLLILQNYFLISSADKYVSNEIQQQQEMKSGERILCPLNENIICNEENEREFHCVCTMFGSIDPAPEKTCSRLLNFTNKRDNIFEAISVNLRIKQSFFPQDKIEEKGNNWEDNYFENKFKDQLSENLKIPKRNIIFLRFRCLENDEEINKYLLLNENLIIIQFIVLRKNKKRNILPPLSQNDLISANTIVNRLKGMKEIQKIGGIEIIKVEKVYELLPVELNFDNSRLIIQAIIVRINLLIFKKNFGST
ncbi:hypothetical protein Mgra_00002265 [Meloidogyne graminicola]|uniref:Uncharacterized protein n=1 Tax=Meloidogyne graminicola TaxID=189291 RepID=A0A8S9ZXB0_9BILA|nr:hypothetical protein Mgra_00002265 [Meloidogyne graminicola]